MTDPVPSPSTPPQLNLGVLRSEMNLTMHTHHASRLWYGRAPAEDRSGIIGLNGFLSITNRMNRGAAQDDPYSDWWMIRIEEKIDAVRAYLDIMIEQVNVIFKNVPPAFSIGDNLNLQPAKMPVFANSPLGFLAIYLLADYDNMARRTLLACHTALIDRATSLRWLEEGAHQLRSLFSLAQRYRYSGTIRDDFAANNAAARSAIEKFGEVPQDILEGERRSRYAPPIIRQTGLNANQPYDPSASTPEDPEAEAFAQDQLAVALSEGKILAEQSPDDITDSDTPDGESTVSEFMEDMDDMEDEDNRL